jgi:hypothetical protein
MCVCVIFAMVAHKVMLMLGLAVLMHRLHNHCRRQLMSLEAARFATQAFCCVRRLSRGCLDGVHVYVWQLACKGSTTYAADQLVCCVAVLRWC